MSGSALVIEGKQSEYCLQHMPLKCECIHSILALNNRTTGKCLIPFKVGLYRLVFQLLIINSVYDIVQII